MKQLRAIACVTDVAVRRQEHSIALGGKDGQPITMNFWVVDPVGLNARGWRLNASRVDMGSLYLSPDLAQKLGLPAKPAPGQTVERVAYVSEISSRNGVRLNPPEKQEVLIQTDAGEVRSLKLGYGGTFEADLKLLGRQPFGVALRFETLLRSSHDKWTYRQLSNQEMDTVIYARTKTGLAGAAREACRNQLDAHMQTWAKGLLRTEWSLTPLTN